MMGQVTSSDVREQPGEVDFCSRLARLGTFRSEVKSFSQAMNKLCTLPYWDRIWIKQEVRLNMNRCFLYGRAACQGLAGLLCRCKGLQWCSKHRTYAIDQRLCSRTLDVGTLGCNHYYPRELQDLVTVLPARRAWTLETESMRCSTWRLRRMLSRLIMISLRQSSLFERLALFVSMRRLWQGILDSSVH